MRSLVFAMLLACGSAPPSPGAPGSTTAPSATDAAGRPACPEAPLDRALGTPCESPGATCGAEACSDAAGFCNLITCRGGTWSRVEVPPPPPPPP